MKATVFQALAEAARNQESVALGIISGNRGSSPQKAGAKAVFYGDGRICGTLGGGCLEAEVQKRAIEALRSKVPTSFDLLLDHDFGWDDGLICGGKVEGVILPDAAAAGEEFWSRLAARAEAMCWGVRRNFSITGIRGDDDGVVKSGTEAETDPNWLFREEVTPPSHLWIAGAGHVAQAVTPLALQLDFAVTVFDDRPALTTHEFFPENVVLKAEVWEKLLATPLPSAPCFGLIVTRGHRHDALVLQDWIRKPFLFLSMIGSSRKARLIFERFSEDRLATAEQLHRVACPAGISIRAQSVMEIAVSIMAQFIEKRAESTKTNATNTEP